MTKTTKSKGGAYLWSPTRKSYQNMKTRCLNPNREHASRYIGRGITICPRWLGVDGFKNFVSDMGERPVGMTLERKDNNNGYDPENCCWATWRQQFNNRCHTHKIYFQGKTQSITMWAKEKGLTRDAIGLRLRVLGWTVEDALNIPLKINSRTRI